ncbi:MAG: hypothetical protein H0X30_37740, partial [Anaerolineae bacterium]|nr:hypothetical protein [Anaerolineae bacterium]
MQIMDTVDAYQGMIADLKMRILDRVLLIVALSASAAVVLNNLLFGTPSTTMMTLWLLVVVCCIGCYRLKSYSPRLATYSALGSALIIIYLGAIIFNSGTFLYLFAILVLVTRFITGNYETFLFSIMATVLILSTHLNLPNPSSTLGSLIILWGTMIFTEIMVEGIMSELKTVNQYQRYAVSQMQEARSNRAVLAQRTKMLDEATQNLQYANSQLRDARRTAETARRLKAQFAANVSHELRTPINLITGFSEMIVSSPTSYGAALPMSYWSDINTIYRNARHLQSLINDILDVSQIEAGQMAIVKEEIDLSTILNEAADMLRDQIQNKGLSLNLNLTHDLPILWLDRVRIRQVIINLLGNALRFTSDGFVAINASLKDNHVVITVADSGTGIPIEELDRVFEEFHQIDNSLSRQHTGSGLGLTLSKRFVEMHGGQIWVESEGQEGSGSQFYISLPVEDSIAAQSMVLGQQNLDEKKMRHFIVMDDDPIVLQLFERYVTKHKTINVTDITQVTGALGSV